MQRFGRLKITDGSRWQDDSQGIENRSQVYQLLKDCSLDRLQVSKRTRCNSDRAKAEAAYGACQGDASQLRADVYQFVDPALESLSAGQKLMLRIGTDNETAVKAQLRALRAQLAKTQ